jgi:hypothetical protein
VEGKTYRDRNIKFLITLLFLGIFSVTILLYLFSIESFLPLNTLGGYNWLNISVFSLLLFAMFSSISCLIMYGVLTLILKRENTDELKMYVVKVGVLITVGVFLVIMLNFFHILDIYWGLGILLIILLALFVI